MDILIDGPTNRWTYQVFVMNTLHAHAVDFAADARVSLHDDIGEVLVFKATFGNCFSISRRFYLRITCTPHRPARCTTRSSRFQTHLRFLIFSTSQRSYLRFRLVNDLIFVSLARIGLLHVQSEVLAVEATFARYPCKPRPHEVTNANRIKPF